MQEPHEHAAHGDRAQRSREGAQQQQRSDGTESSSSSMMHIRASASQIQSYLHGQRWLKNASRMKETMLRTLEATRLRVTMTGALAGLQHGYRQSHERSASQEEGDTSEPCSSETSDTEDFCTFFFEMDEILESSMRNCV